MNFEGPLKFKKTLQFTENFEVTRIDIVEIQIA
jgi:hypothetical protein